MSARQRLSKLLLRHDVLDADTVSAWTQRYRAWLRAQDLGGGAQITLLDHLGAIDVLESRREQLKRAISDLIPGSFYVLAVARLRCLRGNDTLSAVRLCTEIGDFTRPVNSEPRACLFSVGFPLSGPQVRTSTSDLIRHALRTSGSPSGLTCATTGASPGREPPVLR